MIVGVAVIVAVPVIVAALVSGNDIVAVIDTVDDPRTSRFASLEPWFARASRHHVSNGASAAALVSRNDLAAVIDTVYDRRGSRAWPRLAQVDTARRSRRFTRMPPHAPVNAVWRWTPPPAHLYARQS